MARLLDFTVPLKSTPPRSHPTPAHAHNISVMNPILGPTDGHVFCRNVHRLTHADAAFTERLPSRLTKRRIIRYSSAVVSSTLHSLRQKRAIIQSFQFQVSDQNARLLCPIMHHMVCAVRLCILFLAHVGGNVQYLLMWSHAFYIPLSHSGTQIPVVVHFQEFPFLPFNGL